MKNEVVKNTVIISSIALICGLLLGIVHYFTAGPIEVQKKLTQEQAYKTVLPEAETFDQIEGFDEAKANSILVTLSGKDNDFSNDYIKNVLIAKDSAGNVIGRVINVSAGGGYGGNIDFSVGIKNDGNIEGVSITSIDETPGLGMKAKTEPTFLSQFVNKGKEKFALGSDVDSITSATFTSKCITKGINAALAYNKTLGGDN